jgi:hypothetical protein
MTPKRSPVRAGRYTLRKVALEIEEQLRRRGRGSQKEAAFGIGLSEQAFSAKQLGKHSNWSVEEIGRLADFWDAPTSWPWIPWDMAFDRDAQARGQPPRR